MAYDRILGGIDLRARVQTADGKIVPIQYEGPAKLIVVDRYNTEREVRLPRAFYCPDMHTLLSVKQLVLLDHDVTFSRKHGSKLEINGHDVPLHMRDNLYQVRYRTRARPRPYAHAHVHAYTRACAYTHTYICTYHELPSRN